VICGFCKVTVMLVMAVFFLMDGLIFFF